MRAALIGLVGVLVAVIAFLLAGSSTHVGPRVLRPVDGAREAVEPERFALGPVGAPVQEASVRTADNQEQVLQAASVPSLAQQGELHLQLLLPDGRPFAGVNRVTVESLESGLLVVESERNNQETTFDLMLAPGAYRVSANDRPFLGRCGERYGPSHYGRTIVDVDVQAGKSVEVPLRLSEAGHLEIWMTLGPKPDFEAWSLPPPVPGYDDLSTFLIESPDMILFAYPPEFRLEPVGIGAALIPEFGDADGHFGKPGLTNFHTGEVCRSPEPIAAGDYILHTSAPGFPPVAVSLTIRAGIVTSVEVPL